ncbi:BadF/BadG/BcrA/BcrD ATPase family protein [Acetobacter oeni]|uniref:Glucosamine kinase GspK n=1 Tax=Acetobacter oeni TaxID=304077 RepID=A0A511XPY4_9PROT|nr:BadF/BadG/BcrA/BcrD ATPase family protein [Acetobacter oeni]MBB3883559.1 glucosamine kinase [Acetobacter oeni]NHO19596.1 ATPase [Acetobacter oeni]GBR05477.1 putative N-acetylglucosamine kinase [Acetobacter oeni LMG 21952]GEN64956.1 glucosamine kinase GspK [Acetobacter oeni]
MNESSVSRKGQPVLAAIDGGATKTIVRLALPDGTILGEGRGGSANIASDIHLACASVKTGFGHALLSAGLSPDDVSSGAVHIFAGAGMAGAEVGDNARRFTVLFDDFAGLEVRTDAYTSCIGAHNGADGAVVAVGTGSFGYAIRGSDIRRVGGWGFPQSDEGSGAWIGLEAARHMLNVQDQRLPESGLSSQLRNYLIVTGHDPLTWSIGATATQFASLAPVVVGAARAGEPTAADILKRAGEDVEKLVNTLMSQDEFCRLPLCLLGGLAPIIMPFLPGSVSDRLVASQGTAVDGAMKLALRAYEKTV